MTPESVLCDDDIKNDHFVLESVFLCVCMCVSLCVYLCVSVCVCDMRMCVFMGSEGSRDVSRRD